MPAGAAILLDFIYRTETSRTPPECYDVIFGNRQSALPKPLTSMTLGDVIDAQKTWSTKAWAKRFGSTKASSAAGAPQFMRATLIDLAKELHLRGDQVFDPDLQDRLAYHLLKRRGYLDFVNGKISMVAFAKGLAQEWASFPVLVDCRGAHRDIKRGQSFYAGDGLNKALVKPEKVEAVLHTVLAPAKPAQTQKPAPSVPEPQTPETRSTEPGDAKAGALVAVLVALAATAAMVWEWLASLPCDLLGILCN